MWQRGLFSLFCRTVCLILLSKVLCRQIQNVFQRSRVTVFLEDCISLKGKPFNTTLFVVPYENAWIFGENRNWKRAYLTWVIHSNSRSNTVPMKHISSVTCQLSSVSACLMACVLWNSSLQSSVASLISEKSVKKGYSSLLEELAERALFSQNMKDGSEKSTFK